MQVPPGISGVQVAVGVGLLLELGGAELLGGALEVAGAELVGAAELLLGGAELLATVVLGAVLVG